jgi:uncharacterized protein (DUF433 family)
MTGTRHPRIVVNPAIMVGKPTIKGTRVTVELILEKLSLGFKPEAILADHPRLKLADIRAAQGYAAKAIAQKRRAKAA